MQDKTRSRTRSAASLFVRLLLFCLVPLRCAAADDSDQEDYKFKFNAQWWYATPRGSLQGENGPIDFQKDFRFGDYNTFYGLEEWKPRRKHHFGLSLARSRSSASHVLSRQIEYQGKTYFVGETINSELKSFIISPGYEYDFISRPRGHLGFDFLVNLFFTTGSINTQGGVIGPGGTVTTARSVSKSLFAPLPTGGPTFRYYMVPRRLYVDGSISGMYFFGYGNFISTSGVLGYSLGHHLSVRGGYLLGSRTEIHGTSNRLGIRLTQKGPVVGLEGKW